MLEYNVNHWWNKGGMAPLCIGSQLNIRWEESYIILYNLIDGDTCWTKNMKSEGVSCLDIVDILWKNIWNESRGLLFRNWCIFKPKVSKRRMRMVQTFELAFQVSLLFSICKWCISNCSLFFLVQFQPNPSFLSSPVGPL